MIKRFLAIIINGFVMLFAGMGVSRLAERIAPGIEHEYFNTDIFRPWSDDRMSLFWFVPFILSYILFLLWLFISPVIKASSFMKRGVIFGFVYWILTIPGMIITYSSMQISGPMVTQWSASALVQGLCAGLIFARVFP